MDPQAHARRGHGRVRGRLRGRAPVYDAEQLLADEHLRARGTFVQVDDPDLGPMTVQAPVAVLTETPGRIDHLGRHLGADSDAVFGDLLGIDPDRLGRPPGGRRHLTAMTLEAAVHRTPCPTLRAGHTGQQREDVREGGRLRCRSRLPGPRGRMRPGGQRGGAGHGGGRADRMRLGPNGPCRPGERPGDAVVPRRHHRGRHRGSGVPRRAHRAQGAHRLATSGGSTCSSPSSRPSWA